MLEIPAFAGAVVGMHYGAHKTTRDVKSQSLMILVCMALVIAAGIAIAVFRRMGMEKTWYNTVTVSGLGAATMVALVVAAYLAMDAPDTFAVTGSYDANATPTVSGAAAEADGDVAHMRNALIVQMIALFFLSGMHAMYVRGTSLTSAIGAVYAFYLLAVIVRKGALVSQYRNLLIMGTIITAIMFHALRGGFAAYRTLPTDEIRKYMDDIGLRVTEPIVEGAAQSYEGTWQTVKHFVPLL